MRFISIWFRHLSTDWFSLSRQHLKDRPFVLRSPSHGRMIVSAANAKAEKLGIERGMVLADARAIIPELEVMDDKPDLIGKLLRRLAEWCIRFTPVSAADPPDGILLDVSGCSHLWGGDQLYAHTIKTKLLDRGYDVRVGMADTAGTAWAVARFGKEPLVIPQGCHIEALLPLPPEALRLQPETTERFHKLGLHEVRQFIHMPRPSLRRRFSQHFIAQLDKALGQEIEIIEPVQPMEPYHERLPCMEPITTSKGIEIALLHLLNILCIRLTQDQKGLRSAVFKGYRVDGKVEQVAIGTSRPSHHVHHLFKLFEIKITMIEPALGIELFVLEAPKVEDYIPQQEKMWEGGGGLDDVRLFELIDRLSGRIGMPSIKRFIPDQHYWPERSFRHLSPEQETGITQWRLDKQHPLQLLPKPEPIEVTAPIPDYPPMLFIYKGKLHKVVKADGPERIEQEWWIQQGLHRDYYSVEDEEGNRYWLFRSGHYGERECRWFLHGFFA